MMSIALWQPTEISLFKQNSGAKLVPVFNVKLVPVFNVELVPVCKYLYKIDRFVIAPVVERDYACRTCASLSSLPPPSLRKSCVCKAQRIEGY
jgi:hypothetical protein